MSLYVPKKDSTRYDLLDSLADGSVWSITGLIEDTGRSAKGCYSVIKSMERDGLITWRRRQSGQSTSKIQITALGQQWLWAVNNDLPGQAVSLLMLMLRTMEDGPMLSSQLTASGRARNAMRSLRQVGAVNIEIRRHGSTCYPSRLSITAKGRDLLDSYRRLGDA